MNHTTYINLIQQALEEKWNYYKEPPRINEDDLKIGIKLFSQIAVETIEKQASEISSSETSLSIRKRKRSSEKEHVNDTNEKIKKFVADNWLEFSTICESGFPFSLLDSLTTKSALEKSLDKYGSSIVSQLLLKSEWITEKDMDNSFGVPFERLHADAIGNACYNLLKKYHKNNNYKAGYSLLWLIKRSTGSSFNMPEKKYFDETTVTKFLSQFIQDKGAINNTVNFLEIFHYGYDCLDQPLYVKLLNKISSSIFINFTVDQLQKIPMDIFPRKGCIITAILERISFEDKGVVAKTLATSNDEKTSMIGVHILEALKAPSLREASSHFSALKTLMPHIDNSHIEKIFGRPFVDFRMDKFIFDKDPDFTRRLSFNDMREVFVHNSLMIGVTRTGGNGIPPHLLAYDTITEKLVWGIPLTPKPPIVSSTNTTSAAMTFTSNRTEPTKYSLKKVGEMIALQFVGETSVRFIDPKTGDIDSSIEVSKPLENGFDGLLISPQGLTYQIIGRAENRKLIGGKIINGQWRLSFETETPDGLFDSYSTHCGFHENIFQKKLTIFGPTGDQIEIHNCLSAMAKDKKLYTIEKDLVNKDMCILTIRTLREDSKVLSDVEECISINKPKVSFGDLCQNGLLILYDVRYSECTAIFVDLIKKDVQERHKFCEFSSKWINTQTGELWAWEQISHKIWKVSSDKTTLMGTLSKGEGTSLLHVDKENRFYFADIS